MHYLLNNKHNFSKFLFGSSRIKSLDSKDFGEEWYNMTYSFGIVSSHLSNLKFLLKNNIKVEEIIISLNETILWKKPKDFESDYLRRDYPKDILDFFYFYKHYLFKQINKRDIDIFTKDIKLKKSYNNILFPIDKPAFEKEKKALNNPILHKNKISQEAPILLSYNDTDYRINEVINEIKQIISICKKHKIRYKFIFMPVNSKIFLSYNFKKIDEFKTKLSKITDFSDLYLLDELSINQMNWEDSSHLFPFSSKKYIKEELLKPKFLLQQTNIKEYIKSTHFQIIKNLFYSYTLDKHSSFNFKNMNYLFKKIKKINISNESFINIKGMTKINKKDKYYISNNDPMFEIQLNDIKNKFNVLTIKLKAKEPSTLQIFTTYPYSEKNSKKFKISKGFNKIDFLIDLSQNKRIRIDPVSNKQEFFIDNISLVLYKIK